jgi:5-methylthioadenosine/S-adenosylhomocysteine deaminase
MASNNRMHLLEEARLALLAHRARNPGTPALSAARALELATIGGARCLDLHGEIGSLQVGKAADFAAFPLNEIAAVPHADPIATAVFALGGTRATTVAVAGELRVLDGRLLGADDAIADRVRMTGDALHAAAVSPSDAKG